MNNNKVLNPLSSNKNVLFTSPLEYKNIFLTRTGVFNDKNNSFLECILSSYFSEYSSETPQNKNNIFTEFKKKIYSKDILNKEQKYYKYFYNNIRECFETLYKCIKNLNENENESLKDIKDKLYLKIIKDKISPNIILYDVITDLLPIDIIKDQILNDENSNKNIFEYREKILNNTMEYISTLKILSEIEEKRSEIIKNAIVDFINTILIDIEEDIFKFYLSKITNIDCTEENIKIICKNLNINIYFIDFKTRLPFELFCDIQKYENPLSIIILKLENNFEIIGKLESKNKIKKIFDINEILIERINAFLFNRKILEDKYSDLLKYIKEETIPKTPNNSENNSDKDDTENKENKQNDEYHNEKNNSEDKNNNEDKNEDNEEDNEEDNKEENNKNDEDDKNIEETKNNLY